VKRYSPQLFFERTKHRVFPVRSEGSAVNGRRRQLSLWRPPIEFFLPGMRGRS
jgi:hypothetical protein